MKKMKKIEWPPKKGSFKKTQEDFLKKLGLVNDKKDKTKIKK